MVRVRQSQIQDAGAAPEQVILLPDGSVLNSPDAFSLRTQFLEGSIRQSDYLERLSRLVRKEERIEEKSIRLSQKSSKSSDRPSSIIVTIIDEVIENPQPVDPELPALEASSSNSHIEIHDNINDDENNNAGDDLIVEVSSQQTAVSEPSPVSEPVPQEKVTDLIELYDTRIFQADDDDDDDDDDDNCSSQASVDYPDIPPSVAESSNPHIEVISEHALHADDDEEIECSICWAASSRFYTLSCQHQYCMECLDELIRVAISQCFGAIPKVVCPQPNCGTLLSAQEIQEIASHQVGRQFVYFQMKGEAKDFKNLHNCAVSTCEGVLLPTDLIADTQLIPCRLCGINHCANCFHPQHDNKTCKQAHLEYKERVRKNSAKYQKAKAFRKKIRVGFKAILPTIATKTTMLINPNAKMCPNCFTWIVKRGGCHHMSCAHCHTSFCWDCRSPYHRPHCIINAILFPVAFPVAVAAVAAYTGLAIVPWVSLLGLSKLKATLLGRPWNPSKAFGSSAMMIYHIGNYIAPFPYVQMWH